MSYIRRNTLIAVVLYFVTAPTHTALSSILPLPGQSPFPPLKPSVPIVGNTPGKFQVSPSGAATYSIPIQVPPGINGMQPNLSLNYNSQAPDGLLGLGWSIGGLSVISRCPTTKVQDGFIDGVDFDNNDKYCVDGQRLLVVGTAPDGGTEYRTAINNFNKIISYGTAGNGPAYFKVWTKSGQIMEYATATDSRIEAQGRNDGAVLFWALSKIEDRNGNYLTVSYAEDNVTGESYPTSINYTGNANQGLVANNQIQFIYKNRVNSIIHYNGGTEVKTNKHLVQVNTSTGSSLIRKYQLTYTPTGLTGDSQLTSIEECVPSGNCLPPTMLTWNKSNSVEFNLPTNGPSTYIDKNNQFDGIEFVNLSMERIRFGDFNGDGKTDIYYINGGDTYKPSLLPVYYEGSSKPDTIYLSNSNGTYDTHNTGPNTWVDGGNADTVRSSFSRIKFGDFNGDGLTDVYYVLGAGTTENDRIYLSNGNGTFTIKNSGPATFVSNQSIYYTSNSVRRIIIGDFNGDGRSDVYRINGGELQPAPSTCGFFSGNCTSTTTASNARDTIWFSTGEGTFTSSFTTASPDTWVDGGNTNNTSTSLNRIKFGDFNGDRMTDVYYINGNGNSAADTIYFSNGNGSFTRKDTGPTTDIKGGSLENINFSLNCVSFGDFNGDGLTDVYKIKGWNSVTEDYVYLSKGDGTFASKNTGISTFIDGETIKKANFSAGKIKFGDFNGDGLTDIYYVNGPANGNIDSIYLSKGDGTFTSGYSGQDTAISGTNIDESISSLHRIQFNDFNGDGITDVYYINGRGNTAADTIYPSNTNKLLITKFANSLSTNINIQYSSLSDSNIYTKETNSAYPERDIQAPIYAVAETAQDNGINSQSVTKYTYRGMKIHLQGRGSLGFSGMNIFNITKDIRNSVDYRQDYPFTGMPKHTEKWSISTNQPLSEANISYAHKSPYTGNLLGPVAPYASQSSETIYDLNSGQEISTTTITSTYDDFYGNPLTTAKVIFGNGETFREVTTNNYYAPDTTNWCISMTSRSNVVLTGADSSIVDRSTEFLWDNIACRLTQSTVLPGEGNSLEMTSVYSFDSFGNRSSEAVSGPINAARTTTTNYISNNSTYPDGLFATTIANTLGHSETREYDTKTGQITKLTGPNGIATCFEYDELGRQVLERQYCDTPYEMTITTTYAWCDATCPQYASYMVTTQQTGSAPVIVYYDKLNRELRKSIVGYSGQQIFVDTKYDVRGQVKEVSEPYFEGDISYWSIYTYDVLGRVESLKPPHTTQLVTTEYNGFTTKVTDVLGRQRFKTENALGQTISVTDALFNTITYGYDAAGNLTTTTDSMGNFISLTYDKRDRKIAMSDPDMGDWSYTYNTFGELLTQTDAKTQTTTMQYDALGRMVSRDAAEGSNTWTYDTAVKGIGKLARMDGAGGNARDFAYDDAGRPTQVTDHIDMQAFVTSKTYDYAGRVDTITYPANFAIKRIYNFNGYLTQVQSTDGATVYWQADSMNARGQILDNTLGNGVHTSHSYNDATGWMDGIYSFNSAMATVQLNSYSFDDVGNLLSRTDQRQGLTETFTYDDLDRVLTADIAGGTGTYVPRTYSYDALGNIINKSDVGNYLYGQNGAGPHAVTQAGTSSYAYDTNGNMTSGAGRTIGYTSFNKPNAITDGGTTVNFYYGADKSRILKVVGSKRTIYVGLGAEGNALYERETEGLVTKNRHYIYAANSQAVAIHTNDGTTDSMEYLHRDHLGSVEAITDTNGQVTERISFDIWGKQRSVDWSDVPLGNYIVNTTNLGFTGHESIPEVGYIHMNGRVYDPVLGRFLSADPNVQSDTDAQSYNRYSYVSNNPLRYTDPTGYFILDLVKAVLSPITSVLHDFMGRNATALMMAYLAYSLGPVETGWGTTATAAATGAAYAAASAAINGGSIEDMLRAAAVGAAFGAVTGQFTSLEAKIFGAALIGMATGGDPESVATAAAVAGFMHVLTTKPNQSEAGQTETNPFETNQGNTANSCPVTKNMRYANSVENLAGKPYGFGANGPTAYDCSSTVCYGMRGENLLFGDYTAHELFNKFTYNINLASVQRGDLIFYDYTSDGTIDHVTTVLGENRMLHPSEGSGELLITTRTYLNNYTSIRGGTIYYRAIDWNTVLRYGPR